MSCEGVGTSLYPTGRPEMELVLLGLMLRRQHSHWKREDPSSHLEHSVLVRRSICPSSFLDWRLLDNISHAPLVVLRRRGLVEWHGDGILLDDRVLVSVNAWVDT